MIYNENYEREIYTIGCYKWMSTTMLTTSNCCTWTEPCTVDQRAKHVLAGVDVFAVYEEDKFQKFRKEGKAHKFLAQ